MAGADSTQTIAVGADHGGFELKEHLKRWFAQRGRQVEDCGTHDTSPVDYPRIAAAVAERVSKGVCGLGIIIDGAGIGSAMVANKFPGVRAALCYDVSSAKNSREHNGANVLTLGGKLIGTMLAEQIVDTWLSTACTEERHQRRVAMIGEYERSGGHCSCSSGGHAGQGHGAAAGGASMSGSSVIQTPPPAPPYPGGSGGDFSQLSSEDLSRIALRIAELAGSGGFPGFGGPCQCDCCGPGCKGHCAGTNPTAMHGLIGMGAGRIGNALGGAPISKDLAKYIDHTLLKPDATARQVEQLCKEALQHDFASVCVNPSYVPLAAKLLKGSSVLVCTVCGFPLGTHVPEIKAAEARYSIRQGATEVDMVINIGALKGGDDELVYRDIRAVVEACMDGRAICKVIIETSLLTDEEKVRACLAAKRARAHFVKTSTGFSTGGATAADVALMAQTVAGTKMGVKASGGIRSYDDMQKMVQAGATRVGASASVKILQEAKGVTESK